MIQKILNQCEQASHFIIRSNRNAFLFVFLSALVIRVVYSSTLENRWYFYDTVHYDKAARAILNGEGFGSGYYFSNMGFNDEYSLEPIYPIFLAAVYGTAGRNFFFVRIVQSILGALICWFIFLIAARIKDRESAFIAALIGVVFPLHVFVSGLLYVTLLFTFFISGLVYFLLKMNDEKLWLWPVLAGLFLGLATLSIPIVMAFYPFLGAWILFFHKNNWKGKLRNGVVVFSVAIISLVPWTLRNYKIFHRITPVRAAAGEEFFKVKVHVDSDMKIDLYENPQPDTTEVDMVWFRQTLEEMKKKGLLGKVQSIVFEHPDKFIKRYLHEFLHFWTLYPTRIRTKNKFFSSLTKWVSIVTFGPVLLFAIIGFITSTSKFQQTSLLLFLIASFAFAYSFFMAQVRYRVPIEPMLIVFAGIGVKYLFEKVHIFLSANLRSN